MAELPTSHRMTAAEMAAVREAADEPETAAPMTARAAEVARRWASSAASVGEHDEHHWCEEARRAGEPPILSGLPPRREKGAAAHSPIVALDYPCCVGLAELCAASGRLSLVRRP